MEEQMSANEGLDTKQQSMVSIGAFTATGNIEKLKLALHMGLDAGLMISGIILLM
jgi:4-carboxymuconolactone decarboxylase